jgi:hypothetical protein
VREYLGEEVILSLRGTPFENYTIAKWALYFIERYGQVDGLHHKQWVLDQVAKILHGTPVILKRATWQEGAVLHSEFRVETGEPTGAYRVWVEDQEGLLDDNGEPDYTYSTGFN